MTELRHDEQRRRATGTSEVNRRAEHLTRDRHATVDNRLAVIEHEQPGECLQAPSLYWWQPDESWSDVGSIRLQIPSEKRGHEQRHDGYGPPKSRQFHPQPQVRLIRRKPVNGQIRALHAHHGANLRRYALLPRQAVPDHYGFPGEQDRGALGIDRFIDAAHAVSRGVDRVFDDAAANGTATGPPRHERPAKPGIRPAAGLFAHPSRLAGPVIRDAEHQLACAEREGCGERDMQRMRRYARGESRDGTPQDERQEPDARE